MTKYHTHLGLLMETLSKINLKRGRCTVLWIKQDEDTNWRVLNTIDFSSNFRSIPRIEKLDMNDTKNQLSVVRELRDGWRSNGPWPRAQFQITQFNDNQELIHIE